MNIQTIKKGNVSAQVRELFFPSLNMSTYVSNRDFEQHLDFVRQLEDDSDPTPYMRAVQDLDEEIDFIVDNILFNTLTDEELVDYIEER